MSDPMAESRGRQLCSDSWVMLATGFCIMVVASPGVAGAGRVAEFFYDLSRSYTSPRLSMCSHQWGRDAPRPIDCPWPNIRHDPRCPIVFSLVSLQVWLWSQPMMVQARQESSRRQFCSTLA
jgi:hypothetical protein